MNLKVLVSLKKETKNVLEKYRETLEVHEFENETELRYFLGFADAIELRNESKSENMSKCVDVLNITEMLLIAATDETIALGKEFGIATIGYLNSEISGQSLSGVEYLIEGFEEVDVIFLEKAWKRCHRIPWTIAETKRCIIRELCLDDMDALFELYSDEELTKYTESLFDYEEEWEYQHAYINNMYRYFGYGTWLVFLKETGELIGRAGLEHREYDGETEIELGYLIATKHQRKGYAKEVCEAILDFAKEELDVQRLNCLIEEGNTPSIKMAEALGFSYMETIVEQNRNMLRFVRKKGIIRH